MNCFHPWMLEPLKYNEDTKKMNFKLIPFDDKLIGKRYIVPCGKCLGCRIRNSQDWANRLMMEAQCHIENYFVTLTYSDKNMPKNKYFENGIEKESMTLVPNDVSLFMKRLRKQQYKDFEIQGIKFYCAGEYGPEHRRPHYHLIIFGLHLPDLKFVGKTPLGYNFYESEIMKNLWQFGFITIEQVSRENCAYVARYTLKKMSKRETDFYDRFNIVPEFSRMSLRPAIGFEYYQQHKDEIYKNDEIFLTLQNKGVKCRPPAYFDKLYLLEFPEKMQSIKEKRLSIAETLVDSKVRSSDLSYLDMLKGEEIVFKHKIKSLKRGDVKNAKKDAKKVGQENLSQDCSEK